MTLLVSTFILQLICIPTVIAIFKIWERIPASFVATTLFLIVGGVTLVAGLKTLAFRGFTVWGGLQFVILFAVPIALMRFMNTTGELGEMSLGPLRAADLHQYSNISFIVMMALTAIDGVRLYRAGR